MNEVPAGREGDEEERQREQEEADEREREEIELAARRWVNNEASMGDD